MPLMTSFHKVDALAHYCFHQNNYGLFFSDKCFCIIEGLYNFIHFVSIIKQNHSPAKSLKFGCQVSKTHDFICRSINLLAIPING